MNSVELKSIFESSYKEEFDKNLMPFEKMYESAIDKKYAVQYFLGIIGFVYLFRTSAELEKLIIAFHDHTLKLGGTIEDVIIGIPGIITDYKRSQQTKSHFEPKKKNTLIYKRFLGIPYKIERVIINGNGKIGSAFEDLITVEEIAAELGHQRALLDLTELFKAKYVIHGGQLGPDLNQDKDVYQLPALKQALSQNDLTSFFKILQSLFATLPYSIKINESYFHSHIHVILQLLGFDINSEIETNSGRIDAVIQTTNYIYIFEFKINSSIIALNQIKDKKYYQRYLTSPKKIILVGVAFDIKKRNIAGWQMETLNDRHLN